MNLAVSSIASGSSGNCYVVKTENTALLVDAGISCKRILAGLNNLGLCADDISGVLITHEHSDHIQGLKVLQKHVSAIYANEKTFGGIESAVPTCIPEEKKVRFACGDSFKIGDILVESFKLSHDALDPCGYSFLSGDLRLSIVTDTGFVTEAVRRQIELSDILVLESNHDENILKMGPYPWFLKQRILSDKGHLSNEAAGEALADVMEAEKKNGTEKKRTVLLAHLSKENNFPQMASATVENVLEERGISPKLLYIETLSRDIQSKWYTL